MTREHDMDHLSASQRSETRGLSSVAPAGHDILLLASLLALTGACSGVPEPGSLSQSLPTYVLAEEPILSVGEETGEDPSEDPYWLYGASDATLQSDGSVAVVICPAAEVRYFDADGRHVRTVGVPNPRPGDVLLAQRVFRLGGDTLAVTHFPLQGLTLLAPDGSVVKTVQVDPPQPSRGVFGRLSNGSFVARQYVLDYTHLQGTTYRTTASIYLLDESGSAIDSLVGLPAADVVAPASSRGPTHPLRLTRGAVVAVGTDAIYYGGQDDAGVIEFNPSLERVGATRTITRPKRVTEEDRVAYQRMRDMRAHVARDGGTGSVARGYAEEMPAFGDIVAGRDGWLWVENPVRPGLHPLTWTAYEDGRAVARVELPVRFFPFEFGRDWVLGVSYDARTVETVQLRRLTPAPLPGLALPPRDAEPPGKPRCGAWASR